MTASKEEAGTTKPQSASVRFIEQFLKQGLQGRLAGLLLGQLDAFNRISTTFGHDRCEAFCAEYTEKLREVLGPRTPIIGLPERRFAVLLDADSMSAVMDVAIRLTEEHPPRIEVSGDTFLVDVTLGIAVYPSHADDAVTLFRRAELALKGARDTELSFDIYRPDATSQQAALWKFESELRNAVQQKQLEVYFQPKVEIDARRVCGVEALVRWRAEAGRFVPASDFIPLAERSSCIVDITWLVFDRIAERVKEWKSVPKPFSIAVNVSPQVLPDADFVRRLRQLKSALDDHGFGLTIEITEDRLLQADDASRSTLERIRKLGVDLATIAIDDKDRKIVKTVIALAHGLGMRVVAEGVDTAEALEVVSDLRCEMAQGFYIGRPMRGDLVPGWLDHYLSTATNPKLSITPRRFKRGDT